MKADVARIERSDIRGPRFNGDADPVSSALKPGYSFAAAALIGAAQLPPIRHR